MAWVMFESSCEIPFMNCLSTPTKICGSNCQVWILSCVPVNSLVFISNWQGGSSCFSYSAVKTGKLFQTCLRTQLADMTQMVIHGTELNLFCFFYLFFFSEAVAIERNAIPLALYRLLWRQGAQQSEESSKIFRRIILKPMHLLHLHTWV